jgi:hypothetical protein
MKRDVHQRIQLVLGITEATFHTLKSDMLARLAKLMGVPLQRLQVDVKRNGGAGTVGLQTSQLQSVLLPLWAPLAPASTGLVASNRRLLADTALPTSAPSVARVLRRRAFRSADCTGTAAADALPDEVCAAASAAAGGGSYLYVAATDSFVWYHASASCGGRGDNVGVELAAHLGRCVPLPADSPLRTALIGLTTPDTPAERAAILSVIFERETTASPTESPTDSPTPTPSFWWMVPAATATPSGVPTMATFAPSVPPTVTPKESTIAGGTDNPHCCM